MDAHGTLKKRFDISTGDLDGAASVIGLAVRPSVTNTMPVGDGLLDIPVESIHQPLDVASNGMHVTVTILAHTSILAGLSLMITAGGMK